MPRGSWCGINEQTDELYVGFDYNANLHLITQYYYLQSYSGSKPRRWYKTVSAAPGHLSVDTKRRGIYLVLQSQPAVIRFIPGDTLAESKGYALENVPDACASVYDAERDRVYVTSVTGREVYGFKGGERVPSVVHSFDPSLVNTARTITVDGLRRTIYVAHQSTPGSLSIFQEDGTGSQLSGVETVQLAHPEAYGIAIDRVSRKLFITHKTSPGYVSVYDIREKKVTESHKVGPLPTSIAVDSNMQRIYVANGDDTVTAITWSQAETKNVQIRLLDPRFNPPRIGQEPVGLALDRRSGRLYVTCRQQSAVFRLDGNSLTVDESYDRYG